jgi:predicted O-methyltransferase YrrM
VVETIERDTEHVALAKGTILREGYGNRVRVLRGRGGDVLPELDGPYDLIFSDGDPEELPQDLEHFLRLLRPGGSLLSANLFLAQFVPDLTGIDQMAEYRQRLLDNGRLLSTIVPDGLAVSVLRPNPDEIK